MPPSGCAKKARRSRQRSQESERVRSYVVLIVGPFLWAEVEGICGDCFNPFHMVVNRPFLFFVRDNVTNSLLFAGAVMDPSKH